MSLSELTVFFWDLKKPWRGDVDVFGEFVDAALEHLGVLLTKTSEGVFCAAQGDSTIEGECGHISLEGKRKLDQMIGANAEVFYSKL